MWTVYYTLCLGTICLHSKRSLFRNARTDALKSDGKFSTFLPCSLSTLCVALMREDRQLSDAALTFLHFVTLVQGRLFQTNGAQNKTIALGRPAVFYIHSYDLSIYLGIQVL